MVSTAELEKLMEASIQDARAEPAFFRALLEASLYVHTPKVEPPGKRQLVMFKSPDDGRFVVPVFTDETKADWATRGNVRVLELKGRNLLEQIRGSTLMLNPNDTRCTLYPQEIERLLRDGEVAPVQKWTADIDGKSEQSIYKLDQLPKALVRELRAALPGIREVEVAYLAGLKWAKGTEPDSLVIALGGDQKVAERSVRTLLTALYDVSRRIDRPIDVVHFDSHDPQPEWIKRLGIQPVYRRQPMKPNPAHAGYN